MTGGDALRGGYRRAQGHHRLQWAHRDRRAGSDAVGRDAKSDKVVAGVGSTDRSPARCQVAHLWPHAHTLRYGEGALERGHLLICLWCIGDVCAGQVRPDANDLDVG